MMGYDCPSPLPRHADESHCLNCDLGGMGMMDYDCPCPTSCRRNPWIRSHSKTFKSQPITPITQITVQTTPHTTTDESFPKSLQDLQITAHHPHHTNPSSDNPRTTPTEFPSEVISKTFKSQSITPITQITVQTMAREVFERI